MANPATWDPWPECSSSKLQKYLDWLSENRKRADLGWGPRPLPGYLVPCREGPPDDPDEDVRRQVGPREETITVLNGGSAQDLTTSPTSGGTMCDVLQELGPWGWAGIGLGLFLLLLVAFFVGRETV